MVSKLKNALYVWESDERPTPWLQTLFSLCFYDKIPIQSIFFNCFANESNELFPDAYLKSVVGAAHSFGLKIEALTTSPVAADLQKILNYNDGMAESYYRFDAIHLDYEPPGGPTDSNISDWYHAYDLCRGKIPLNVDISWRWTNEVKYNNIPEKAYQHILRNCDVPCVMAYWHAADVIWERANPILTSAGARARLLIAVETQQLAPDDKNASFYDFGEADMLDQLEQLLQDHPIPEYAFAFHYFQHAYDSGEAKWPLHRGEKMFVPIGSVLAFMAGRDKVPSGYLITDGRSLQRSDYPDLFQVIGTIYGHTTDKDFNLPNLQGVFLRGLDPNAGRDPDAGRAVGSYQSDAFQNHHHSTNAINADKSNDAIAGINRNTPDRHDASIGDPISAGDTWSEPRVASETRPKNMAVVYIIRVL